MIKKHIDGPRWKSKRKTKPTITEIKADYLKHNPRGQLFRRSSTGYVFLQMCPLSDILVSEVVDGIQEFVFTVEVRTHGIKKDPNSEKKYVRAWDWINHKLLHRNLKNE